MCFRKDQMSIILGIDPNVLLLLPRAFNRPLDSQKIAPKRVFIPLQLDPQLDFPKTRMLEQGIEGIEYLALQCVGIAPHHIVQFRERRNLGEEDLDLENIGEVHERGKDHVFEAREVLVGPLRDLLVPLPSPVSAQRESCLDCKSAYAIGVEAWCSTEKTAETVQICDVC